jgi:hypothetical protein
MADTSGRGVVSVAVVNVDEDVELVERAEALTAPSLEPPESLQAPTTIPITHNDTPNRREPIMHQRHITIEQFPISHL